ncbi:hypothetical protein Tco_0308800 [Tanacetum coccineum]
MGDEHFDTIPEKESNKLIKSRVENLFPIPSEFEDFSDNESECDMPECDETFLIFNKLFLRNPLFDQTTISTLIDPHYFNVESNLIESLLKRDILIDSSPKFDYLLEEFSRELAYIDPIPSRIEKADFDLEEEIHTILESLSPSPIPVADSDSLMEEIDLFLAFDDSMPPGIEDDDYDSEGDIREVRLMLKVAFLQYFGHYGVGQITIRAKLHRVRRGE